MIGKLLIYAAAFFGLFTTIFFLLTLFAHRQTIHKKPLRYNPIVTVCVPMFNVAEHLRITVESLLQSDYPKDKLDIIIVDDGSTDSSLAIAKEYEKHACVRVLHQENQGKCTAINNALKIAKGEFYAVLDVDAYVAPDALKKMLCYFTSENVMAVTPSLKVYNAKTWLQKIQLFEFFFGVYLRKVFAFLGSIHVTPGCFSIYRKSFFDKTGYYQEGNLTEDIEVAYRIQDNDWIIENAIDASVYTVGHTKFRPLYNQRLRWYKGFLDNTVNYKHIFFNKKFGNLGYFVLPSAFISVFFAISLVLYTAIQSIDSWIFSLKNFHNTGYDFTQFLTWNFDWFFLNLNGVFFVSLITLAFSIGIIVLTKNLAREKAPLAVSFIIFSLFYLFLYSSWWTLAGYYKVMNKKIRWGKKLL